MNRTQTRSLLVVPFVLLWGCGDVQLFVSDAGAALLDGSIGGSDSCGDAPPPQCVGTDTPRVCFENVTTCPGGTVDIPIHVETAAACPATLDQGAGFVLAPFELANPQSIDPSIGRCLRREVVGNAVEWAQLSSSTIADGCPDSYSGGVVDVLRLRVPVDLPPGDYRPEALWGLVQSGDAACSTMRPAQTPLIRVVAR